MRSARRRRRKGTRNKHDKTKGRGTLEAQLGDGVICLPEWQERPMLRPFYAQEDLKKGKLPLLDPGSAGADGI